MTLLIPYYLNKKTHLLELHVYCAYCVAVLLIYKITIFEMFVSTRTLANIGPDWPLVSFFILNNVYLLTDSKGTCSDPRG